MRNIKLLTKGRTHSFFRITLSRLVMMRRMMSKFSKTNQRPKGFQNGLKGKGEGVLYLRQKQKARNLLYLKMKQIFLCLTLSSVFLVEIGRVRGARTTNLYIIRAIEENTNSNTSKSLFVCPVPLHLRPTQLDTA